MMFLNNISITISQEHGVVEVSFFSLSLGVFPLKLPEFATWLALISNLNRVKEYLLRKY